MQGDNLVRKTSQNKGKCIHWLKNGLSQIVFVLVANILQHLLKYEVW